MLLNVRQLEPGSVGSPVATQPEMPRAITKTFS
jgi:hypothetical protein